MPQRCSRCGARRAAGADLLLCPELQLIGYPPEDLVLKPEFVRRAHECTDQLVEATAEPGPAILFGTIVSEDGQIYNALMLADGGRVLGRTLKHELPNYGTFDEKRVFTPGPLPEPIEFSGVKLGVPICEDIWQEPVCAHLAEAGRRDAAGPQRQPLRARQGRHALAAGPRAARCRPACRSPISTASAARTSWCSTARRSSCTPTASSSSRCADWDEALLHDRMGAHGRGLALRDPLRATARCRFPRTSTGR